MKPFLIFHFKKQIHSCAAKIDLAIYIFYDGWGKNGRFFLVMVVLWSWQCSALACLSWILVRLCISNTVLIDVSLQGYNPDHITGCEYLDKTILSFPTNWQKLGAHINALIYLETGDIFNFSAVYVQFFIQHSQICKIANNNLVLQM